MQRGGDRVAGSRHRTGRDQAQPADQISQGRMTSLARREDTPAPKKAKHMADFTKLIADIQAKISATRERLAYLREKRRPHALGAFSGDEAASVAVAEIAADEIAAR